MLSFHGVKLLRLVQAGAEKFLKLLGAAHGAPWSKGVQLSRVEP